MPSSLNKISIQEKCPHKAKKLQEKDAKDISPNISSQKSPSSAAVIKIRLTVSF